MNGKLKKAVLSLGWAGLLLLLWGCNSGDPGRTPSEPLPEEIVFDGIGTRGIFDPCIALDPDTGRIWMSYSLVGDSAMWPDRNSTVSTRLAFSDDAGKTFQGAGLPVNTAEDVVLPLAPPNDAGTWNHEVSAIACDPGAPADQRWKMLWHRYLWVNGIQHFEHGWIAMRTAPAPDGPWSAERKLFAGSLYDSANDVTIGPPEVVLDQLDPALAGCLAFSEPGMVAAPDALYVALLGPEFDDNRILLLKWPHPNPAGTWQYLGSFLTGKANAAPLGYDGFSAPDMFAEDDTFFLMVTPQTANRYLGVFVFEIEDLEQAKLVQDAGGPVPVMELYGADTTHNGAATYIPEASQCGILYSEVYPTPPLYFRIYKSFRFP